MLETFKHFLVIATLVLFQLPLLANGDRPSDSGDPCNYGFKLLTAPPAKVIDLKTANPRRSVNYNTNRKERPPEVVGFVDAKNAVTVDQFMSHGMISRGNEKLLSYLNGLSHVSRKLILTNLHAQGVIGFELVVTHNQLKEFIETGLITDKDPKHPILLKPIYKDAIEWLPKGSATVSLVFDLNVLSGNASSAANGDSIHQEAVVVWALKGMLVQSTESRRILNHILGSSGWVTEGLVHQELSLDLLTSKNSNNTHPLTLKRKLTPYDRYYIINPMKSEEFTNLNLVQRLNKYKSEPNNLAEPILNTIFWLNLMGTHFTVKLADGEIVTGRVMHFNPSRKENGVQLSPSLELITKEYKIVAVELSRAEFLDASYNPVGMGVGRIAAAREELDHPMFERSFSDEVRQPQLQSFRLLPISLD